MIENKGPRDDIGFTRNGKSMLARKEIKTVKPYVPGKPIEEVKRELGLKDIYKLASNENSFGPSPKAVKAIEKALGELHRYPDGSCYSLRKELAKRLKVKQDELVFGNGSDEIIILALRAFVDKNDEVIVSRPSFLVYEIATQITGAKLKIVPLKDYTYDLDAIAKSITKKTKLIFIANPNNPTGTYVDKDKVKSFLRKIPKDVIVFFDEAYFEYAQGKDFPVLIPEIKKHNIIVARTFSKIYGLAGLRVGYAVANKTIADYLNRVREPFNVNTLAQKAAYAALGDTVYLNKTIKAINREKKYLYKEFAARGLDFIPSSTNFILINCKKAVGAVVKKLLKQGVIVRDMSGWNMDKFIRVTVGSRDENKKMLKAMDKAL